MFYKDITYTDYNGEEKTERAYFHMPKPELVKLDAFYGGIQHKLDEIQASNDAYALYNMFEDIIRKSYGVKSDDGTRFVRKPEIAEDFLQSAAYEALFVKLITNPEELNEFMSKVAQAN